jgi:hypothetical protein
VWAACFTASLGLMGEADPLPGPALPQLRLRALPELAADSGALAAAGAACGLVAGLFVGLYRRWTGLGKAPFDVAALGLFGGGAGGALVAPAAVALSRWLHPVAGSALAWALVGALVGLLAFALSREDARAHDRAGPGGPRLGPALLWGLAGAACAGGAWASALAAAQSLLGDSFFLAADTRGAIGRALLHASLGGVYGLLAGAVVGALRGKGRRASAALALGCDGAAFGASGGALSVLAVVAAQSRLHPLASSSLAWAAVGFVAALLAYFQSRSRARWVGAADEDDEQPADATVEWVLRGRRKPRRWRDRAWFRVLPAPLASACALAGAAVCAPSDLSVGLLAVGALGLAVSLILYNQECRIRELERRFRQGRESGPRV